MASCHHLCHLHRQLPLLVKRRHIGERLQTLKGKLNEKDQCVVVVLAEPYKREEKSLIACASLYGAHLDWVEVYRGVDRIIDGTGGARKAAAQAASP